MSKQDKCDSTKFYNPIWIFLEQDLTQFSRFTKNIIVRFEFKTSLTAHFLQSEWLSLMKAPFMLKESLSSKISCTTEQTEPLTKSFIGNFLSAKVSLLLPLLLVFDHWLFYKSKYYWKARVQVPILHLKLSKFAIKIKMPIIKESGDLE